METPARPAAARPSWGWGPVAGIALAVLALDQASKLWVRSALGVGERVTVLPSLFELEHVRNPAGAFGLLGFLDPGPRSVVFLTASVLGLALVLGLLHHDRERGRVMTAGLSLVLGGALGNFLDRALLGSVVDFLHVYWGAAFDWPNFNVADAAICVGLAFMLADAFRAPLPLPLRSGAAQNSQPATDW